jgi:hypothetical protein
VIARLAGAFVGLVLLTTISASAAGVLYDGSVGSTPDRQGWLLLMDPPLQEGNAATQTAQRGVTVLDSMTDQNDKAGYFGSWPDPRAPYQHPLLPTLDRTTGYVIRLDVRLLDEVHRFDRAGFGVIAISEDLQGVELEFWKDEIWLQADDPLFTHGEGVPFDAASGIVSYELKIQGDRYVVSANGDQLLSGPLKDYTEFGPPYTFPSFLFIGDDTTTAAAKVEIARVEVDTL